MGSEILPKLPVLDFSRKDLEPGTTTWFKTCNDVRQALEDYGCFIMEYNKLPPKLCGEVFGCLKDLFDLPTETKMKNRYEKPLNGYVGQILKLPLHENQMVTRMVFESYGMEKYYDSYKNSINYLLRVLKNRSPKGDEPNLGFVTHTDKSFTTILHQNQINGLEIDTRDGQKINVDFSSPSSFVVIAGDAFMA
ncbi:hypothetical protein Pint_29967 [Pistacia integerrima]|uniref:Uncharacterized protein n=1 Tax=Pistacia integerrima TaxID=434235 RepID=A0ACC0X0B0_9ROSI|nr:hypothetical protein Pint_29967 [Pistacia integerrima]